MRLAPDGSPLRSGCSALPGCQVARFHVPWLESSLGAYLRYLSWVLVSRLPAQLQVPHHYGAPSGRCDAVPVPCAQLLVVGLPVPRNAHDVGAAGECEKETKKRRHQTTLTIPSGHVGTHMRCEMRSGARSESAAVKCPRARLVRGQALPPRSNAATAPVESATLFPPPLPPPLAKRADRPWHRQSI